MMRLSAFARVCAAAVPPTVTVTAALPAPMRRLTIAATNTTRNPTTLTHTNAAINIGNKHIFRSSVRVNSTWIHPSRPGVPLQSLTPPFVDSEPKSILIYATPGYKYMSGAGLVLVLIVLPATLYFTWPLARDWWIRQLRELDERFQLGLGERIPQPKNTEPIPIKQGSLNPDFVDPATLARNIVIGDALLIAFVAVVLRFHTRLVHRVRLYPDSKVLAMELVGWFGKGRTKLVPVESVLPPLALAGHDQALHMRLRVGAHPQLTNQTLRGEEEKTFNIQPPEQFHVFPMPNIAGKEGGLTQEEQQLAEQFWLRTLTTGVHTNEQIESMRRLNKQQ